MEISLSGSSASQSLSPDNTVAFSHALCDKNENVEDLLSNTSVRGRNTSVQINSDNEEDILMVIPNVLRQCWEISHGTS